MNERRGVKGQFWHLTVVGFVAALTLFGFAHFCFEGARAQEEPPPQHTEDPSKCVAYCHPKGVNARPKGTPEGIPGYECEGDHCAKAAEEGGENPCDENGEKRCTRWCAKPCCSCLAVCL